MISGFARRYEGQSPHYEVWYGKVDVAPGKAMWFRYTILDGVTREASTWAILFDGDETIGGRELWTPEDLSPPHTVLTLEGHDPARFHRSRQVFHVDDVQLDERNAIGHAGPIEWDLHWSDSARRFSYMPEALFRTGIVKSTYEACLLDLRVEGTIVCDGRDWELDGRPGMVGHIQGKKISGERWAWGHCNSFDDDPDAVFEGLSVDLRVAGGLFTLPASAFVLHVDDHVYSFRTPLSVLVSSRATFEQGVWRFETSSGGATLSGEARAPASVALVEYTDTDDSHLWCYNSKLADLSLHIEDRKRGVDRRLTASGASAFEFVTRERPSEPVLI